MSINGKKTGVRKNQRMAEGKGRVSNTAITVQGCVQCCVCVCVCVRRVGVKVRAGRKVHFIHQKQQKTITLHQRKPAIRPCLQTCNLPHCYVAITNVCMADLCLAVSYSPNFYCSVASCSISVQAHSTFSNRLTATCHSHTGTDLCLAVSYSPTFYYYVAWCCASVKAHSTFRNRLMATCHSHTAFLIQQHGNGPCPKVFLISQCEHS